MHFSERIPVLVAACMYSYILWCLLVIITDEALEDLWLVFHIPCFEIAVKNLKLLFTVGTWKWSMQSCVWYNW